MSENIKGYIQYETIRQDAGSPGIDYIFSQVVQSVMIDNLGSPGVYGNFDSANGATTGSTDFFIPDNSTRIFDLRVGSVNLMAQTGSPSVQVIGLIG